MDGQRNEGSKTKARRTIIRIAVGLRVGTPLGQLPHQCSYGSNDVDQFFRHGLSCRFSQGRLSRHNTVASVIQHALTAAKIPTQLEPSGLYQADGNCHGSLGAGKVPSVGCHMCRHFLPVTLSKSSHRARRSCCTCGRRQDQEVCTPGPHVSILPSCCGDMWHRRSQDQGLSEGAWQTFKDGERGIMIVSHPNAENFRCHSKFNWECNSSNCDPPCQCNN